MIVSKVVEVFGLRRHMKFETTAVQADWQDEKGTWKVKLQRTGKDGQLETFEDEGEVLLWATGLLNERKWPNAKGLKDFKGRVSIGTVYKDGQLLTSVLTADA